MREMVIKKALQFDMLKKGIELAKKIEASGYSAMLVGGCVRDLVRWTMNRCGEPSFHDVDIATNMPMDELYKHFICASNNGEAHGTILVQHGGVYFEVTQYRSDGAYEDGRHPSEVKWAETFEEDSRRRDFTMNALGLDTGCKVIDYHMGIDSIYVRTVATVGDAADRFGEDALRILRACRFAARFDYRMEPHMKQVANDMADCLEKISMERIHDEFCKCAEYGVRPFCRMLDLLDGPIGKSICSDIDWCMAFTRFNRLQYSHWEVGYLFPLLLENIAQFRKFKCSTEDMAAFRFIQKYYPKYIAGTLDFVDMVDGMKSPYWEVFRAYIKSRMDGVAISRKHEEKVKAIGALHPDEGDISQLMLDNGWNPGPEFGVVRRAVRLAVLTEMYEGRTPDNAWVLDKLSAFKKV